METSLPIGSCATAELANGSMITVVNKGGVLWEVVGKDWFRSLGKREIVRLSMSNP
jgi:hypothetical protein